MSMNDEIERMLIIAYSAGYDTGHHDTVEGNFKGDTRQEHNDWHAKEWLAQAKIDGDLERHVEGEL